MYEVSWMLPFLLGIVAFVFAIALMNIADDLACCLDIPLVVPVVLVVVSLLTGVIGILVVNAGIQMLLNGGRECCTDRSCG